MIPLHLIVNKTRAKVDIRSRMWNRLITATGQPRLNGEEDEEAKSISPPDTPKSPTPKSSSGAFSVGFSEGSAEEPIEAP